MPRKKKIEIDTETEEYNNPEEPLYCSLMQCPNLHCLLHYKHAPFGRIIRIRKFRPDKEWNCKDIVTEIRKEK